MPRFIPSLPIADCYGSVGEHTFYHRNGVCYYKKRARPEFPGTMLQMEQQSVHLRAIAVWQSLPASDQREWNRCAVGVVSHRPPFDGKSGISGYNLFVSAYHGHATLGNEHIPAPMPWEEFPAYAVDGVASVDVVDDTLRLGFSVCLVPPAEAGRYWLLVRLQLAKPGGGVRPGKMRNFLASAPCPVGDSVVPVEVPDFASIWGLDLPSYALHCRYRLLDSRSGYRNNYRKLSAEITL